jgi:RNA polymerase sigma factor (sigma-70 family)
MARLTLSVLDGNLRIDAIHTSFVPQEEQRVVAPRNLERFSGGSKPFSRSGLHPRMPSTPVESPPSLGLKRESRVLVPRAPTPPPSSGRPPEEVFLENLPVIREIISHCGRRFSPQDAEDFSGTVMCRLIEYDYKVIREFRGRSNFRTYLTVAIKRMLLDYQNHLWGKWHYSAEAKRLGPIAMRLEALLYRDWYSFDEACRVILGKDPKISRQELEALEAKLPYRIPRRFVGVEPLETEADRQPGPHERAEAKERGIVSRRVFGIVHQCIKALPPEDQVLVWMRMELSVANIARLRRVDQKPLYRRLDKIYEKLQKDLARHGVRRQDIEAILGKIAARLT